MFIAWQYSLWKLLSVVPKKETFNQTQLLCKIIILLHYNLLQWNSTLSNNKIINNTYTIIYYLTAHMCKRKSQFWIRIMDRRDWSNRPLKRQSFVTVRGALVLLMVTLMCRWENPESSTPVDRTKTHCTRLKSSFIYFYFWIGHNCSCYPGALEQWATKPPAASVQMLSDRVDECASECGCEGTAINF